MLCYHEVNALFMHISKAPSAMKTTYLAFIVRLMLPIARFALRHALHIQEIIECLKSALVKASVEQLEARGEKVTTSRLSIMTGIHRKDIDRLRKPADLYQGEDDMIVRVVGHWQTSKKFLDKGKRPRALSHGTVGSEFHRLVEAVNRELNPATVLFELERVGVVERSKEGLCLKRTAFAPSDKIEFGLKTLADDCNDLLEAVDANLSQQDVIPNHHARTVFDKVRASDAENIRTWLVREGHELHRKARDFLASKDQEINPDPNYKGETIKVALGSFSRIFKDKV